MQLLSPTWDEAAVAAAAVPANASSTFPLFTTLTVPHGFSQQHPFVRLVATRKKPIGVTAFDISGIFPTLNIVKRLQQPFELFPIALFTCQK